MNFDAYRELPGINWSSLKLMDSSPLHFKYGLTHPRPDSSAMQLGRAAHCAVLEPDAFPRRYVLWDGGIRRGKTWDAFQEANADKECLNAADYETALAIRDAVRAHKAARRLLRWGKPEVSLRWLDESSRMWLKARLDWVAPRGTLVDLKTSRDIEPRNFGRTAANLMYHGQLAFYRRGLIARGAALEPVYIVAVESSAPFDVLVYEVDEDVLFSGDQLVTKLLHQVKACRRRYGKRPWPGRSGEVESLEFPSWALPADNDLTSLGIGFEVRT